MGTRLWCFRHMCQSKMFLECRQMVRLRVVVGTLYVGSTSVLRFYELSYASIHTVVEWAQELLFFDTIPQI